MATAPRALTNITIQFNDDDTQSERTNALNRLAQAISAIAAAINGNASNVTPISISFADPTGMVELEPVDGVLTTAMRSDAAPPLDQGISPVWTSQHIFDTDNLKNTLYPQIVLRNSFNATPVVPQWSPLLQWIGQGWDGVKSEAMTFVAGVRPGAPGVVTWVLSAQVGGAGFFDVFSIDQNGVITDATWEGNVIAQKYGGTGHTTPYAPGVILIGDAGGSGLLDVEPLSSQQIQWNQIVGAPCFNTEDGEDGMPGPPGQRGATGPAGPSGSGGGSGSAMIYEADGEDGAMGPPGAAGARGATGATGATGAAGKNGVSFTLPGEDGEDGMRGAPGQKGATGATGATGAAGAAGSKGPPGDNGNDGEDGMMIAPNTVVLGVYPAALAYGGM